MGVKPKHKVGRNEPCPCGSGLKFKYCHNDPLKTEVCNRVANEKMVELIRAEQRKQIIRLQQAECEICGHTGIVPGEPNVAQDVKCDCQFVTDEERIKYKYDQLNKGD